MSPAHNTVCSPQYIRMLLNLMSDLSGWINDIIESALQALKDVDPTSIPVELLLAYQEALEKLERAAAGADRISAEIAEYIDGYSVLERVDQTALIVFAILVAVIFLGVLTPIFALLATSRRKSIWRPVSLYVQNSNQFKLPSRHA